MDPIVELLKTKRDARKAMARGLEQSTTERQRRNWRKWMKQNETEIAALQSAHEQIVFASALKRSVRETADTILAWVNATFGDSTRARSAERANEEMTELLTAVHDGAPPAKVAEECADVVICLVRLCAQHGGDLFAEVERKMQVNRNRKWALDGTGCGYHVREQTEATS